MQYSLGYQDGWSGMLARYPDDSLYMAGFRLALSNRK